MTDISTVKTSLLTKLSSLSSVAVVSGYMAKPPWPQYPAAALVASAGRASFAGTHHNRRDRGYTLSVFVDNSKWNNKTAEDMSISILEEIEVALDADSTLSGLVAFVAPAEWDTRFAKREFDVKILEVTITATEIVTAR